MKRPLVWAALALIAGIYAGALGFTVPAAWPEAWPYGTIVVPPLILQRYPRTRFASVLLLFAAVGVLQWSVRCAGPQGDPLRRYIENHPKTFCSVEGRIRKAGLPHPRSNRQGIILEVARVQIAEDWIPLQGRAWTSCVMRDAPLYTDERIRVRGTLRLRHAPRNPGEIWIDRAIAERYIRSGISIPRRYSPQRIAPGRWWQPGYWASRLRMYEARRLAASMPRSALEFVYAVWLGDKSLLRDEDYYRRSGTAHILAVSGVHVGIVFISISFLLGFLVQNRALRASLIMGGVFMFALVAGARAACRRSAIMISLFLLADLFGRERDAPTALSIAAILFLAIDPACIFDLGFLLSFSSVASLLLFQERMTAMLNQGIQAFREWRVARSSSLPPVLREPDEESPGPVQQGIRSSIGTTFSVLILPLPLSARIFHIVPLIAPLANLVIVPLLTITLWLSFITTLCAMVSINVAIIFGYALSPFVWAIRATAKFFASIPGGHPEGPGPTPLAMALHWGAAALLWHVLSSSNRRRIKVIGIFALAVLTIYFWRPAPPEPGVTFLDVGHGDAAFVMTPEGNTILIDGGDGGYKRTQMGERGVGEFLFNNGISHLDCVFVSHSDLDHIGGLTYVLDHFSVGQAYLGPFHSAANAESSFLALCALHHIPVVRVKQGDTVRLGNTTLDILHPPRDWPKDCTINDASVVMLLRWDGLEALFTGDIEAEAEAALLPLLPRVAVLKVPHHGSTTSSSQPFLEAVRPKVGIISTGAHHGGIAVSQRVLNDYAASGTQILRTDLLGGITMTAKEGQLVFRGTVSSEAYCVPFP